MSDIVDEIDRLVDESLNRPITDDYHANRYDKCWHCNRDWHGIPVTEKIAQMYMRGVFDDDYLVNHDSTPVLCPGSDFIGPVAAESRRVNWAGAPTVSNSARRLTESNPITVWFTRISDGEEYLVLEDGTVHIPVQSAQDPGVQSAQYLRAQYRQDVGVIRDETLDVSDWYTDDWFGSDENDD